MDKTTEAKNASSNTKRIAKNTLMLYFRQILIMLVSLYTVRVVLNVLGAEDYGIYNVVAGVVTMFAFLSNAMASASQRYFSFDLGKNDEEHLKITFSVTFQIYILLAIFVIVIAETLGLWFVNHKLVIPEGRLFAANCIYQTAIFSFLMTIITTPFMASIIAHENMNVYAYVSIVEASLKLGIVFLLKILPFDKLIIYGFLLAAVSVINTSLYRFYCHTHYVECKYHFVKDFSLFKELISYSGWNMFGSVASVILKQGITILLNIFFGPFVNAARAVSSQVSTAIMSFSQNFSNALRPQIIKLYAAEKKEEVLKFLVYGTKIVFFLMLIICIPFYFQVPYILRIWLKQVPDYTILFVQLVTIHVIIDSVSFPLMAVVQATGKIRLYQAVVGGTLIMNLPISYIFLKLGFPPETVFIVEICVSFIALLLRIIIAQKLVNFKFIFPFIKLVFLFIIITVLSSVVPVILINRMNQSFGEFVLFVMISLIWTCAFIFIIGFNKNEKKRLFNKLISKKNEN